MGKLLIEARREWDDPVDLLSVRGTDRDALGRNLPKKAKAKELKKDIINAKGKHGPKGKLPEASMTKSVPSKKESVFNKGVEKSLGQQVAVIVLDHPDSVAYGVFKRIGETGLCHIKLNGGKLPGWAAGDMIAVRPSEVYSTWDPRIAGKTAVHREYDDQGNKTVREGEADPRSELDKMIEFHQLGLANARYKGPMATMHRKKLRNLLAQKRETKNSTDTDDGRNYSGMVGNNRWNE
jgi:hypothetical protein